MTQERQRFNPGTPQYGAQAEDSAQATRLGQILASQGATAPSPTDISRLRADAPDLTLEGARTRQDRTLEEQRRANNWRNAFAFIGGGTKWGVIETPWKGAPSWVRLVNPIKTAWTTMGWFGEEVGPTVYEAMLMNPLVGPGLSTRLMNMATFGRVESLNKFHKDLESQMRESIYEQKGIWNKVKGYYELARQRAKPVEEGGREQIFPGEKFVGGLVSDPLNLAGFGILGKVPVVGRIALPAIRGARLPKVNIANRSLSFPKRDLQIKIGLGDFEDGYIKTVEAPFRWGARLYRKLPNSRAQSSRMSGLRAAGVFHEAITTFTGKQIDQIDPIDKDRFIARILDPAKVPDSQLSRGEKELRDILFDTPEISQTDLGRLINNVDFADSALKPNALDVEKQVAVSVIYDMAIRGKISVEEAAKRIIDELGGIQTADSVDAVRATVKNRTTAVFQELQKLTVGNSKSVSRVKAAIAGRAFNLTAQRVAVRPWQKWGQKRPGSVSEIKSRQGAIAGLVGNTIHRSNQAFNLVMGKILYDMIGRPLSGMVLMFPAFSFQNAGEDMIRMMLGQTKTSRSSLAEFNEFMLGFDDIPTDLLGDNLLGSDNLIRGVSGAVDQKELLRAPETVRFLQPVMDKLPNDRVKRRVINGLGWMHPKAWRDKSSVWSRQYRRSFMMQRSYQRIMSDLLDNEPELLQLINQSLPNVQPDRAERLKKGIMMRLHLGGDAINKYSVDLASDTWDQEEMISIISKYLNDSSETVFTDVTRASLEEWVANPNRTTRQLRQFMKGLKAEAYSEYISGAEGVRVAVQLAADTFNNISSRKEFADLAHQMYDLTDQLATKIDDIELTAGFRAAQPNVRNQDRQRIWYEATDATKAAVDSIAEERGKLIQAVRDAEKKWMADVEYADTLSQGLNADLRSLIDYRGGIHSRIEARFQETSGVNRWKRDDAWWREHYDIRTEFYEEFVRRRENAAVARLNTQNEIRNALNLKSPPTIKSRNFNKIGLKEIAAITGGVPDSVVHGMYNAAFMTEEQWVDFIIRKANSAGHTGVTRDKLGAIYRKVMGSANLKNNWGDGFKKYENQLFNLEAELKAAARIKVSDNEGRAIREFAQGIADELDGRAGVRHVKPNGEVVILYGAAAQSVSKRKLKERLTRFNKAVSEAHEDLKQTFVNYADQTVIDDAMKTIFPFWKYETARLPFLFRTSITHPIAFNTNHPDGKYWQGTEEGYIHPSDQPWNDTWGLNPIGGTLFNSTKRMVNAEYPASEQTGVMGKYVAAEDVMERFGFYPGPHIGFFTKYAIPTVGMPERKGELGEVVPDLIQSPLQLIQQMNIPGISNFAATLRNSMFHDRFSQHMIAKHLIEAGYNPKDVNFETLTPAPGSRVPADVLEQAVHNAARVEWASAQLGMVRWRGDSEVKYREARDNAVKTWTKLSQKELDGLRRDGISVLDVVPMPKPLKAAMFEINNADGFNAARALLEGGEQRRISDLTRDFYKQVDNLRTDAKEQIDRNFLRWQRGELGGQTLRDIITEYRGTLATAKDALVGRKWDPEINDYRITNPDADYSEVPLTHEDYLELRDRLGSDVIGLRHPFDELLDTYYTIRPQDKDNDGIPEYDEFFDAQEAFLRDAVPNEYRELFIEHTERNMTEPEKALRHLRRNDLGEYFSVARDVADTMNFGGYVDEYFRTLYLGDDDHVEVMRSHPLYRTWTRQVNDKKKRLRETNPRIDYALRAFGYTTTWANPVARNWWEIDGRRYRLDRMWGSRSS